MSMKQKFMKSALYFVLFISVLYSSCGKENGEPRLQSDTEESVAESLKENDSLGALNEMVTVAESERFDSAGNPGVKYQKISAPVETEQEYKTETIVYYFHATARCPSCINIEKFTEELIKTSFAEENRKGVIFFRELNIEDSVNEHFIEDYNLQFSSVILARFVNSKQVKWKNLEHVWKLSSDKKQFFKYASTEIKDFLKEEE